VLSEGEKEDESEDENEKPFFAIGKRMALAFISLFDARLDQRLFAPIFPASFFISLYACCLERSFSTRVCINLPSFVGLKQTRIPDPFFSHHSTDV
jgi:hypothetical protein